MKKILTIFYLTCLICISNTNGQTTYPLSGQPRFLSYACRMTGDSRYKARAETEIAPTFKRGIKKMTDKPGSSMTNDEFKD